MKILLLLTISILISFNAFADQNPDFICLEESGVKYKVYESANKISVFDVDGTQLKTYEEVSVVKDTQAVGNMPPITAYDFTSGVNQDELGYMMFVLGNPVGFGEMVGKDQGMNCALYDFRDLLK